MIIHVGLLLVMTDWSYGRLIVIASVVTTHHPSTILCFNKQRLTQVHLENGR